MAKNRGKQKVRSTRDDGHDQTRADSRECERQKMIINFHQHRGGGECVRTVIRWPIIMVAVMIATGDA